MFIVLLKLRSVGSIKLTLSVLIDTDFPPTDSSAKLLHAPPLMPLPLTDRDAFTVTGTVPAGPVTSKMYRYNIFARASAAGPVAVAAARISGAGVGDAIIWASLAADVAEELGSMGGDPDTEEPDVGSQQPANAERHKCVVKLMGSKGLAEAGGTAAENKKTTEFTMIILRIETAIILSKKSQKSDQVF
jgi:hypothetical protein